MTNIEQTTDNKQVSTETKKRVRETLQDKEFAQILDDVFSLVRCWKLDWIRPSKRALRIMLEGFEQRYGDNILRKYPEQLISFISVCLATCLYRTSPHQKEN